MDAMRNATVTDATMTRGASQARRRLRRAVVPLVLALGLAACSPIVRNHGYVPAEAELATIEVGRDTRETVAEKIGRPSTEGLLADAGWFYVQSRFTTVGPFAPREEERQVLAITFTKAGTVENIQRFGLEDGRIVPLSRRITESAVPPMGLLRQLFGNIGQIGTGAFGGGAQR